VNLSETEASSQRVDALLTVTRYMAGELKGPHAIQRLTTIADEDSATFDIVLWLSRIHMREGNYTKAISIARECLTEFSTSLDSSAEAEFHFLIGHCYLKVDMATSALSHFRRAWELDPELRGIHEGLAYTFTALSDMKAAERQWVLALNRNPESIDALLRLSDMHIALGNAAKALEYVRRARFVSPENPEAALLSAVALEQLGFLTRAESAYQEVLQLCSEQQADMRNDDGVPEADEKLLAVRSIAESSLARILVAHARAIGKEEKLRDALKKLDRAIVLAPEYADAYAVKGALLAEAEQWNEARSAYQRYIAMAGQEAWSSLLLGRVVARSGDQDEALALFNECVRMDPSMMEAWAWICRIHIEKGRCEDAGDALRSLSPSDVDYVILANSVAACFFGDSDLDSAESIFRMLIEACPNEPSGYYNLAETYLQQGRKTDALDMLEAWASREEPGKAINHLERSRDDLLSLEGMLRYQQLKAALRKSHGTAVQK
jgi:tetratricopeptide (TPR) repeat protein